MLLLFDDSDVGNPCGCIDLTSKATHVDLMHCCIVSSHLQELMPKAVPLTR